MFDEIIIRQDKHLRGMKDTEIIAMLKMESYRMIQIKDHNYSK